MLTILTARGRGQDAPLLTKTLSLSPTGDWIKTSYDRTASRFDAEVRDPRNIHDLAAIVRELEVEPHKCIVRGLPKAGMSNIRRAIYDDADRGPAGLIAAPNGLSWVMLDFDSVPVESHGYTTEVERLAHLIGTLPEYFHNVTCYYQWSASAGMDGWSTLSAHLYFWLDQPWMCGFLHTRAHEGDWSGMVDPATFVVTQPHFTCAPIYINTADPLEGQRSGLLPFEHDAVVLPSWSRPILPRPEMTARQHHAAYPNKRFEELLAAIGPNYHFPILKAAAHYASVTSFEEFDRAYLYDALVDAIHAAPPGRNNRRDYLCRRYLNRIINGAVKKFGGRI